MVTLHRVSVSVPLKFSTADIVLALRTLLCDAAGGLTMSIAGKPTPFKGLWLNRRKYALEKARRLQENGGGSEHEQRIDHEARMASVEEDDIVVLTADVPERMLTLVERLCGDIDKMIRGDTGPMKVRSIPVDG